MPHYNISAPPHHPTPTPLHPHSVLQHHYTASITIPHSLTVTVPPHHTTPHHCPLCHIITLLHHLSATYRQHQTTTVLQHHTIIDTQHHTTNLSNEGTVSCHITTPPRYYTAVSSHQHSTTPPHKTTIKLRHYHANHTTITLSWNTAI